MVSADIKLGDWIIITKRNGHLDRSYVNETLEVKSIDGDFILGQRTDSWGSGEVIINTAFEEVKRVSDDFKEKILKMREEFKKREEAQDGKAFAATDPDA